MSNITQLPEHSNDPPLHTWDKVCVATNASVYRFSVPGGWLYQAFDDPPTAPVFVPAPHAGVPAALRAEALAAASEQLGSNASSTELADRLARLLLRVLGEMP